MNHHQCPNCAAFAAARDAILARAEAAEAHTARLATVVHENSQRVAELGEELRTSSQRTHELITTLMTTLDECLCHVFNASADQVSELRELLGVIKVSSGTTQPADTDTVILAKTERVGYAKYQLHAGTARYIAGVSRMSRGKRDPCITVREYGTQGNGTNLRKFIRERVEPALTERLLGDSRGANVPRFKGFFAEWFQGTVIDQQTFETLLNDAACAYYDLQAAQDPEAIFTQHAQSVGDVLNDVYEEIAVLAEAMFPLHPLIAP